MERSRTCVRPGCGAPAEATLTYHYASRTAWLDLMGDEHEPASYDLCHQHADRFTVPLGWNREDRRVPAPPAPRPERPEEFDTDDLFGIQIAV
jgi:hypothetical protein